MSDPNKNRKGYKATKVGWIPKAWECVHLGDCFEESRAKGKTGVATFSVTTDRGLIPRSELDRKMAPDLPPDQSLFVRKSDITYNMMRMWQGAVAVAQEDCVVSPAYVVCRPLERTSPEFFLRLFKSHLGLHKLWSYSYGITNDRLRLYYRDFSLVPAPLPPLAEQQEIAAILSTWDDGLEQLEALVKAKTRQKEALMQQLLTGDTRLPGFEGDWIQTPLYEILRHVFRPVAWHENTLYDLVSIRRRAGGLFRRGLTKGADYKTKDLHSIQAGDLLISKRQVTHGALTVVPQEFEGGIVSKEYSIFENIAPKRLEMSFLNWLTKEKKFWWICFVASNGVDIEKLIFVPKDFLKSSISLPPTKKEQTAIATLLTTAETELTHLRKKQLALRQQKKSLMQKLLTGQVRVATD